MKTFKKIEIGEYIITIEYEDTNSGLEIGVYDDEESLIESLSISDDVDDEIPDTDANKNNNPDDKTKLN